MDDRLYLRHLDRPHQWLILAEEAGYNASKLATLYGVSLRTIERYFDEDFGRKPTEWLNEQRMILARKTLLRGKSVRQVSNLLQLKQLSHFSSVFKRVHGVCPSPFKQ